MEAIREIVDIRDHKLSFNIPETFNYHKVEVVILPLSTENIIDIKNGRSLRGALKKYANKNLVSKEALAWSDVVEEKYENSGC